MSLTAGIESQSSRMDKPSEAYKEATMASSRLLADTEQDRSGGSHDRQQYAGHDTSSEHLPNLSFFEGNDSTGLSKTMSNELRTMGKEESSLENQIHTFENQMKGLGGTPTSTGSGEGAINTPPTAGSSEAAITTPANTSSGEAATAAPPNTSSGEGAINAPPTAGSSEASTANPTSTNPGDGSFTSPFNTSSGEASITKPFNTGSGEAATANPTNTVSLGDGTTPATGTTSTTGGDSGTTVSLGSSTSGDAGFVGMFGGDTDAQEANSFSSILGKTVIPSTYLDYTQPEAQTAQYNIGQYGSWTAAHPGVGMIVGVPLTFNGQTLASSAAGDNNAEYTALAQQLVAAGQGNDTIRLGIEMNGSWAVDNNDGNPADSVNAYNQEAQAMKAVPGANFSFDWNVSGGDQNGISNSAYYPGNANVNSIGVDVYDWNEQSGSGATPAATWNLLTTEAGGLNDMAALAQQNGKTFAIPEYAVSAPQGEAGNANATSPGMGDDPSFINNIASFLNTQSKDEGVAFQSYFDSGSGGVGTTLETSPNSLAAYTSDFSAGGTDGAEV